MHKSVHFYLTITKIISGGGWGARGEVPLDPCCFWLTCTLQKVHLICTSSDTAIPKSLVLLYFWGPTGHAVTSYSEL